MVGRRSVLLKMLVDSLHGVGTEFPIKMYMLCTYNIVLVIPVFEMRWFRIASTAIRIRLSSSDRVALHSYMSV